MVGGLFMAKLVYSILLIALLAVGLVFVDGIPVGKVQNFTNLKGVVSSDTVWTKENSPYNLTDNVFVNNGVTLTIDSGVTVNFNGYYLMVNGTLAARGTATSRIQLKLGVIIFKEGSTAWNEQTNTGCIIEYADLATVKLFSASPKISENSFYAYNVSSEAIDIESGSPIITYNNIIGPIIINGSLNISNNNITTTTSAAMYNIGGSAVIENNNIIGVGGTIPNVNKYAWSIITGVIMIDNGSPSFINNSITGLREAPAINACGGSMTLLNNGITGGIGGTHVPFTVEGNVINGPFEEGTAQGDEANPQLIINSNVVTAIYIYEGSATIENNLINDIVIGTLVTQNRQETLYSSPKAIIENNTINGTITYESAASSIINYNNLQIQGNQPSASVQPLMLTLPITGGERLINQLLAT